MRVHLLDGTYELFRHYHALPGHRNEAGHEVDAVRGVVRTVLSMLEDGVTHLAVATDHLIESFRNELWEGYKDGSGIESDLLSQFEPLEDALRSLGVVVWAMDRHEADDALAAGARRAAEDDRVRRVLICTPDKDLAQCVVGDRVVLLDRRSGRITDEDGVRDRFGVRPASIPDYLALVGDAADGYPGLPNWGSVSASRVLARYGRIEAIPERAEEWEARVRGAKRLATTLTQRRDDALLFRRLATLDVNAPVSGSIDDLLWSGPTPDFPETAAHLDAPELVERAEALVDVR